MGYWKEQVPIFVTRPTANKTIFDINVPMWLALLLALIVLFNLLLWGGIGVFEAISWIFMRSHG
jgi:hypothetical protein